RSNVLSRIFLLISYPPVTNQQPATLRGPGRSLHRRANQLHRFLRAAPSKNPHLLAFERRRREQELFELLTNPRRRGGRGEIRLSPCLERHRENPIVADAAGAARAVLFPA